MPKVTLPGTLGQRRQAPRPRRQAATPRNHGEGQDETGATGATEAEARPPRTRADRRQGARRGREEAGAQPAGADGGPAGLDGRDRAQAGATDLLRHRRARCCALLAAGAALYFGLAAKYDSATKSDVDALTKKVDALQAAATKNSKDTQNALNASAAQLQASISALQRQQSQNAASIATLQSQAAAGAFGKGAAAGTPGAALTPGRRRTTTPKKRLRARVSCIPH